MTEEEAKTKWCPMARDRDGAGNRVPYGDADADPVPQEYARNEAMVFPCIGSACMAWRWRNGAFPLPNDPPSISGRYEGYCGLAGHP